MSILLECSIKDSFNPKLELVNNRNTVNTVSDVSRGDWWRRWLYSTNAKDIGTLYLYFAIFSGIFIMPLQNLAIYWKVFCLNINSKYICLPAGNFYLIRNKRVHRDFMQELLLLFTNYPFPHKGEGLSRCKEGFSEKTFSNTYTSIKKILSSLYIFLPPNIQRIHINSNVENKEFSIYPEDNQLGYYLAGLIEADGSIIVPKDSSKSNNTPTISISFNIEDKPLAYCIKSRLLRVWIYRNNRN